jgi:two-component sensor histidine kinase
MGKASISINSVIEELQLDISKAVPLGLIINEIITNAFKHAFKDQQQGELSITLKNRGADIYALEIRDSGVGLPPDFDVEQSRSLGMKLIKGLSEQIHARLQVSSTRTGTKIAVVFDALHDYAEMKESA